MKRYRKQLGERRVTAMRLGQEMFRVVSLNVVIQSSCGAVNVTLPRTVSIGGGTA